MGWRFRKTVRLGGFVRLNFSNSGVSLGLGPRGASINVGKRGVRSTVGFPGTGISHQSFSTWNSQPTAQQQQAPPADSAPSGGHTLRNIAIVVGILFTLAMIHAANDKAAPSVTASTPVQPPKAPAEVSQPTMPPPAANRPLAMEEVKEAQKLLKELGFDPGGADGIVGPYTIAAVKRYEPSRGWPASGEVDIRLLESLRASKASPSSPTAKHPVTAAAPAPAAPPASASKPITVVPSEEMRLATLAIRKAEHPCSLVAAALRLSDGSIKAVCSNSETYRVFQLKGEWFAMRCSAAERAGIQGC